MCWPVLGPESLDGTLPLPRDGRGQGPVGELGFAASQATCSEGHRGGSCLGGWSPRGSASPAPGGGVVWGREGVSPGWGPARQRGWPRQRSRALCGQNVATGKRASVAARDPGGPARAAQPGSEGQGGREGPGAEQRAWRGREIRGQAESPLGSHAGQQGRCGLGVSERREARESRVSGRGGWQEHQPISLPSPREMLRGFAFCPANYPASPLFLSRGAQASAEL